jgi:methylglutaconyl-CoA hydratase
MTRVRVERDGTVARIVLARPEQKNALDRQMVDELQDALRDASAAEDVNVVALGADGGDFCAGADLKALAAMLDASPGEHYEDAMALGAVFVTMREMAKPVVAIVRGRALAGGAGLATAADVVLAHPDAEFGYPEVRVGFVPAMVMTMLRRAVGEKHAFDLVASGRRIGAAEAERIGLVSRVLPAGDFDAAAAAAVDEISRAPSSAVALTKRLFYALDGHAFADGVELGARTNVEARSTEAFRTGVLKFANRG